jgi:hypothetical protein
MKAQRLRPKTKGKWYNGGEIKNSAEERGRGN